MSMLENMVLQAATGFTYDFSTLPGTIVLVVVSAIMVGLAALGIYWAYATIGSNISSKEAADARAQDKQAQVEVHDLVRQAKADMLSDFSSLLDMDKRMKEQLTLARIEESALAKA